MKTEYQHVSDRTAALTEIWREVLGREDVDESSDLVENGSTSLQLLQIVGKIYDVLGVDVRLRDLFTHASPQTLSAFIDSSQA
ncbi:phosphopantetheine-binding protein [Micromonospora sp. NPDC050695]|uniref:phosphopantetheine-binding protein n=1 Tax=Micromonospora sp. NPDC050695 TaxID=3154938 RepID=UPI0033C1C153